MALRRFFFALLFLFCIIFPKGGFKIGTTPITWGYIAFFGLMILSFFRRPLQFCRHHLIAYLATLPLVMIFAISTLINGIDHIGFTLSFIFSVVFIPLGVYICFSDMITSLDSHKLKQALRFSILFLASYGILLFAIKQLNGSFIEIPYLTINAQDAGLLESTKHIDRGGIFKLISTYNNGNLYGICLLMLLPLYNLSEPKRLFRLIVKASLLLTLSRTVWFGLIFCEVLHILFVKRLTLKTWIELSASLFCYITSIRFLSSILDRGAQFLTDPSLGGREKQFVTFDTYSLIGSNSFEGIQEIIYLGFLDQLGILGLIALVLALSTPHILYWMSHEKTMNSKAISCGLLTYLFVSVSDGAFLYIPTMLIYMFLSALLISKPLIEPVRKTI